MGKPLSPDIPAPNSFADLYEWYEENSPEWIDDLIENYGLSWDSGYLLDHIQELGTKDEWESVIISATAADDWHLTFTKDDGTIVELDLADDWGLAWDIYSTLEELDDVYTERGSMEYGKT